MASYLTSRLVSQFSHKASLIPLFRFRYTSFSSSSIAFIQKPDQNAKKDTETKTVPQTVCSPHIHEDFKHEKKSEESTNKEFQISSSSMSSDVKNLIKGVDTAVQHLQCEPAYQVDKLTGLPLEIIDISDKTDKYSPERYLVKIKAPGEDIEVLLEDVPDSFSSGEEYDSDKERDYRPMIVTIDKGDGCCLRVDCCWNYYNPHIHATSIKTTGYIEESQDDFKAELYGSTCSEFNGAVKDFLAAKGIHESMLLGRLIKFVERKRYLAWLESVKDFVGN